MWTFRAMNTDVTVSAPDLGAAGERALAMRVAALFADTEQRFSRFRADSELARLARATEPIVVSPELCDLLIAARQHVAATGGLFDPTVGGALRAAGYDRSFAPGALDRDTSIEPARAASFAELAIDEATRRVYRPPHVELDLGGFLKGRTVDRAAALAPETAMIDAGGDLALRGAGPGGGGWLVDVEDPRDPERTLVTLVVRDRAVATSAANRRRWRRGATTAHHLIDPRTGLPASSDLAQATALAATAEEADVLAKAAFLLGAREGARFLAARAGVGGVLVGRDGTLWLAGEVVAHA